MRSFLAKAPLRFVLLPLLVFAACADSSDDGLDGPPHDGGLAEGSAPDSGSDSAADALDADARTLPCSSDFCVLDLPNPEVSGFTKWMFAGVVSDPVIGIWAIANGVAGTDESTAQLLRFENGMWTPMHGPTLGTGAAKRSVRLTSLSANGAGKLIAVGTTIDDGTTVIVRSDGTKFGTVAFDGALSAVWFGAPGQAWATGSRGGIFRLQGDGSSVTERAEDPRSDIHFTSVWGSGPGDVYVGGIRGELFPTTSYLAHRTVDDAGAENWAYRSFEEMQMFWLAIGAGVTPPGGSRFWAAGRSIARSTGATGDGGVEDWGVDPFQSGAPIRAFWAHDKDDIWAAGEVGRLLHFDGVAWKDALLYFNDTPLTRNLTGIAGTTTGEVFVVGEGIALRREAK